MSPDGLLVAYLADQQTDERFELYGVPADGGTAIEVSDLRLSASDVEDDFQWSPDGSDNTLPSGILTAGGEVFFGWIF